MTRLTILSVDKQRDFDAPSKLNTKKRALFFSLDQETLALVKSLRTPTNQVGFLLQLGYFRSNGKFFTRQHFKSPDTEFVLKILNILPDEIDLSEYMNTTSIVHRHKIIELLQWQPLNADSQEKIKQHIQWTIPQQLTPKRVFYAMIEYCCHNKIEIPSYHFLADAITDAYNVIENNLIHETTQKLSAAHREKLDQILKADECEGTGLTSLPCLTHLKKINQSLRPMDIKERVNEFNLFKEYFDTFKSIIDELNVSHQLTEYYATWTQKATLYQINCFPNKNKTYLRLLCYIKHQFYIRHDLLVDTQLKATQTGINGAKQKEINHEMNNRDNSNKAIHKLLSSNKTSRDVLAEITAIIHSEKPATPLEKLTRIETLVNAHNAHNTENDQIQIMKFEQTLTKIANNQFHFDSLEDVSRKTQRRVSELMKHLIFEKNTSNEALLSAIDYFIQKDGNLGNDAPRDFLNSKENERCLVDGKLNIPLYKMILFIHIANGIKSGALNLLYSYRYKAIQHYLIDEKTWKSQKLELIKAAGLEQFIDIKTCLSTLEEKLNTAYTTVNERFLANQNPYLVIDEKYHMTLTTPKTDSSTEKYASTLLDQAGYVPLIKVLSDINQVTQFTAAFKHHSIKHTKMKPQPEMIFAGITAKGRNMNTNHLVNSSIGISSDSLQNVITWCFSMKNIQSANNRLARLIDKLHISTAFQHEAGKVHTSSDGRKVTVAVDSILASYSYKYFGKLRHEVFDQSCFHLKERRKPPVPPGEPRNMNRELFRQCS